MDTVRIGVIGVGGMGTAHTHSISNARNAKLTAVCDIDKAKADRVASERKCKAYYSSEELIRSGDIDAVIIATPHYAHTTIGIDALQQGLHVLVEKPISVHKADCERLIAAHTNTKQVFAAMFNQRTDPHYKRVKSIIDSGEFGKITRVNWIITDWFRTEAYYASGTWRATWKGEGGGVLLNQCPHNLDLLIWLCGMPSKVQARCALGKWHNIEVEDEVTALLEFQNGATGVFITTTGEAPGTNRLEITGERGKIVLEKGQVQWTRNETPMTEFSRTTKEGFAMPAVWNIDIPVNGYGGQHSEIIQNFVDCILSGTPLIAPAEEGIRSVELANSMLYSSLTGKEIVLPLDSKEYESTLMGLIKNSKFVKKETVSAGPVDMKASFANLK